ncbi:hypothetical protein ACN28C_30680 [Plantactinospora sp. WMMC1484]|uniref:hypothetical protein n=1 Tax=Plantactinospora sp. WMMC1484 TaxID=3404122 RepID=UPI003BF57D1E
MIAEVCQLLGARRLEVKEVRELTDTGKVTASVTFHSGGLLRQRTQTGNALAEHVLELDVSSEAQREVRGVLEIESVLRSLGPSFKGTFDRIRTQSAQLRLRVAVTFVPGATGLDSST